MATTKQTPKQRADELVAEIEEMQALIAAQVAEIMTQQEKNPTRWDYVGTLAHIKEQLADIAGLNG